SEFVVDILYLSLFILSYILYLYNFAPRTLPTRRSSDLDGPQLRRADARRPPGTHPARPAVRGSRPRPVALAGRRPGGAALPRLRREGRAGAAVGAPDGAVPVDLRGARRHRGGHALPARPAPGVGHHGPRPAAGRRPVAPGAVRHHPDRGGRLDVRLRRGRRPCGVPAGLAGVRGAGAGGRPGRSGGLGVLERLRVADPGRAAPGPRRRTARRG